MIKKDDQHINICVRAIIIEDGQVVVCRWKNDAGPSFSIGGRVEYGESLVQALLREVKEETGTNATIDKLLYMHENVYTTRGDRREVHELGYYFLVTCDEEICPNNQISSNPDHPSLFNVRVPVTKEGLDSIFPTFLREYLPRDATMAFAGNPKMVYSSQQQEVQEDHTRYFLSEEIIEHVLLE